MPMDLVTQQASMIFEAAERIGWKPDRDELLRHLKDLQKGLPHEDEFCVLASWLGSCELVHRMGPDRYPPPSAERYRVPDLVVMWRRDSGIIPTLVEVKSTNLEKLKLGRSYLEGLRAYSALVKIPVLVACRWRLAGLWTLNTLESVVIGPTGAGHLPLTSAARDNLLGLLAGDFGVVLRKGAGFHLQHRIDQKMSDVEFVATVVDAYFTDGQGNKQKEVSAGVWQLMLSAPLAEESDFSSDQLTQHFTMASSREMTFAQQLLPVFRLSPTNPTWRELLNLGSFDLDSERLDKDLTAAIKQGFVHHIVRYQPTIMPSWLSGAERSKPS